jgi:hypothetical protein
MFLLWGIPSKEVSIASAWLKKESLKQVKAGTRSSPCIFFLDVTHNRYWKAGKMAS